LNSKEGLAIQKAHNYCISAYRQSTCRLKLLSAHTPVSRNSVYSSRNDSNYRGLGPAMV